MEFSRQESWSGLPCPPPGNLEFGSAALQGDSLPSEPPEKPGKQVRGVQNNSALSQVIMLAGAAEGYQGAKDTHEQLDPELPRGMGMGKAAGVGRGGKSGGQPGTPMPVWPMLLSPKGSYPRGNFCATKLQKSYGLGLRSVFVLLWMSRRVSCPGGALRGVCVRGCPARAPVPAVSSLGLVLSMGFPGGSDGKEFDCNAGDLGLIPASGRSPGEGHGNPLQYSFPENSTERGAWRATVHGVAKSWT